MAVRLKDVAAATGYSLSVVSRALSPTPDRFSTVSAETCHKIRHTAKNLGFQRNHAASCMRKGFDPAIGAFLPMQTSSLVMELVQGMSEEAGTRCVPLNLRFGFRHSFLQFLDEVEALRSVGCLIHYHPCGDEEEQIFYEKLASIIRQGGKVVFINEPPLDASIFTGAIGDATRMILYDDYAGGRMAAEHLLAFDCSRVLMLNFFVRCFQDRARGFRDVFRENGCEHKLVEIRCSPSPVRDISERVEVARALDEFKRTGVLGLFLQSDYEMLNLLPILHNLKLEPGRQIKVVGYSGHFIAQYPALELTTLQQDFYTEGKQALTMLLDLLDGKKVENVLMKPELIIRSSTVQ